MEILKLTRLVCRRYAERTAQLWAQRLAESNPPKRLNLIYLANGGSQSNDVLVSANTCHRGRPTIKSPSQERVRRSIPAREPEIRHLIFIISDVV